jgi:hypothetical protein
MRVELGQALRDFEHGFELGRTDGDGVECQSGGSSELQGFDNAVLQQPARIRLIVDEWRTPTSLPSVEFSRWSARAVASGSSVWVDQRQPADHAAHEADLLRELQALQGLTFELMQHLDQHGPSDAAALELVFGRCRLEFFERPK